MGGSVKLAVARAMDGWAAGLSGLCLAHCLALPVLAALLPALGVSARTEWMHVIFVLFAAPLSAVALLRPVHGRRAPVVLVGLGGIGVALLVFGAFGPAEGHIPVTVAGSLSLVGAHLWNLRRHGQLHPAPA